MSRHQVDEMFMTPFVETLLKEVTDDMDMDNDEDCLFTADKDAYSELGLLTPPWSPCDSSAMDTDTVCESLTAAVESALCGATTRARSDSFLCSCTSCECSGSQRADGPVLRDCMWSETTGLVPPPSLVTRQTSNESTNTDPGAADCRRPCCPAITAACTNHTDRCVDPRNVFPCQAVLTKSHCTSITLPRSQTQTVVVTPDCSFTKSPVYDPDSETSAYCSSFSDDELEEIDVVSVASCNEAQTVNPPPLPARRQVLVLPAAESMSAQVAAMHNYSSTRCRPAPAISQPTTLSLPFTTKCANMRKSVRPRRYLRRITGVASPASVSDSSSDSGIQDERHKRAQHNVMERQRRYNLKSHFYNLRDVVPGTCNEHRVSKVLILSRAVDHIRQLNATNATLLAEHSRLRALQERWKWKLSLMNRDARQAAVCSA